MDQVSLLEKKDCFGLSKVKSHSNLYRSNSGTYYLLVKRQNRQYRRSLKTSDPTLAKPRLRDFLNEVDRLQGPTATKTIHFEDLAQLWLCSVQHNLKASSYRRRLTALKGLTPFFKGVPVRNIGTSQIERWKKQRGGALSAQSWNIESETLRLILRHAQRDLRLILENPAENIKRRHEPARERLIPTKEEFQQILKAARSTPTAGEAGDLLEFLAYSGLRKSEAESICWNHISFATNAMMVTGGVYGTKNNEHRLVPLFPPLKRLLTDLRQRSPLSSPNAPLFTLKSARKALETATRKLQLPHYNHHSMRHFFCSNCIEAVVDFKTIAAWLGHKDGGILAAKTYGHLRHEHSTEMAQRLSFDAAAPVKSDQESGLIERPQIEGMQK